MNTSPTQASVWICDGVEWWVDTLAAFLRARNLAARVFPTYDLMFCETEAAAPQLTLLGCARPDPNFRALVERLARNQHVVVVLTETENLELIRGLFHSGARDVVSRFPGPATLISIVDGDRRTLQGLRRSQWAAKSA